MPDSCWSYIHSGLGSFPIQARRRAAARSAWRARPAGRLPLGWPACSSGAMPAPLSAALGLQVAMILLCGVQAVLLVPSWPGSTNVLTVSSATHRTALQGAHDSGSSCSCCSTRMAQVWLQEVAWTLEELPDAIMRLERRMLRAKWALQAGKLASGNSPRCLNVSTLSAGTPVAWPAATGHVAHCPLLPHASPAFCSQSATGTLSACLSTRSLRRSAGWCWGT